MNQRILCVVAAGVLLSSLIGLMSCGQPGTPDQPTPTPTPGGTDEPGRPTPTPSPTPDGSSSQFEPVIETDITPVRPVVTSDNGDEQPVGASRDDMGVQSDFLVGHVLLKANNDADLQDFLDSYSGTVVRDNTIPPPPAELGVVLTAAQRRPTEFLVRIDLDAVDVSTLADDGAVAGLSGVMEFSSQDALRTFAAIFNAKAAGFSAQADYVYEGFQTAPVTLFATGERRVSPPTVPPTFTDPFTLAAFADLGTGGSQSNITLAWQFIAAHGIQRRVRVAIIDGGFWLDPTGRAQGADSDFPPPPALPAQYDFVGDDRIADNPNPMSCGAGNPCYWHGTGSASVATGIANNQLGAIGSGGQVADPILFRIDGTKDRRNAALRTAVAWGADVVSMSFGGDCNLSCRIDDRDPNPFDDAIGSGSRIVFIASAGNGRGTPAVGYSVGSPSFVHPCIEDNVLCVGALNPGTNAKIGYSNFGGQVEMFAPTNIPAMSYPNSFVFGPPTVPPTPPTPMTPAQSLAAPEQPQVFTGTSASAPLVAGVVAMMKAVNPNLGQREVEQILIETAGAGVAPVTRTLNAYAAVKRAAEMFPIADDRYEKNDLEATPTDLGSAPPYNQANLNIDGRDRDYFKFQSPAGSLMTVNLAYPLGLGAVSVFEVVGLGGPCEQPAYISDSALLGGGRSYVYRVPGGPLRMGLKAADINAYNLGISFVSAAFAPDIYESNDLVSTAKRLQSLRLAGSGGVSIFAYDPRITIDATLHTATDVDYYIVRGVAPTLAEQIFFLARSRVSVYGNDSLIKLDVYGLNADNTQGPLIDSLIGGACAATSLSINLDSGVAYLIRVSGSPGRYTFSNSVSHDERYIPSLVRDRVYEVLHPLDPIEHVLRAPELYVFLGDPAYTSIRSAGSGIRMRLFDFDGAQISEGFQDGAGIRLDLASVFRNDAYVLDLTPVVVRGAEPPVVQLEWEAESPSSATDNLVRNPGAETVIGEVDIPNWEVSPDVSSPRLYFYDGEATNPSLEGPGPADRGIHLFAGGDSPLSGIRQSIDVAPVLTQAINEGRVQFNFSAFLGGNSDQTDYTTATLAFRNANQQLLGQVELPRVTALEREGQTGLFPVETSGYVPENTYFMVVELTFQGGDGEFNDGYADNVELILSEFSAQ